MSLNYDEKHDDLYMEGNGNTSNRSTRSNLSTRQGSVKSLPPLTPKITAREAVIPVSPLNLKEAPTNRSNRSLKSNRPQTPVPPLNLKEVLTNQSNRSYRPPTPFPQKELTSQNYYQSTYIPKIAIKIRAGVEFSNSTVMFDKNKGKYVYMPYGYTNPSEVKIYRNGELSLSTNLNIGSTCEVDLN